MPKLSPARIIAIIIFLYSSFVMTGWIFGFESLTRVLPNQQPMAFVTALSFFLSSITLWILEGVFQGKTEMAIIILPATVLTTLMVMTTLVAASIFGAYTGITDLFLTSSASQIHPGMPAVMTVMGFVFFGILSIDALFVNSILVIRKIIRYLEFGIITIGLVAILGYIIGVPLLTYQFTQNSTPMALNTAIAFIFLGTGVYFTEKQNR